MENLTLNVSQWQHYLYTQSRFDFDALRALEDAGKKIYSQYDLWQRELFARLYEPQTPKLTEIPDEASWALQIHDLIGELPEFQMLQEQTAGDAEFAAKSTAVLARSFMAMDRTKNSKVPRGDVEAEIADLDHYLKALAEMRDAGIDVDSQIKKANTKKAHLQDTLDRISQPIDTVKLRGAMRKAATQAVKDQKDHNKMMSAFSFGGNAGSLQQSGNIKSKRIFAKHLSSKRKLREIALWAGRLKHVAMKKQRSKSKEAKHEFGDIEQGADLAKLLPSEMLSLCGDEISRLLFFKRYTERQVLQYQLKGKESKGLGALVVCVDESSSMSGDRDVLAKATMLALMHVAIKQKRTFAVIHFSGDVGRVDVFEHGAIDPDALVATLENFEKF